MKKRELKKLMNSTFSKYVPNNLNDILQECPNKKEVFMKERKNYNNMFKLGGALVGVCAIITFVFLLSNSGSTMVTLDVNPSIALEVNKKERITEVDAKNDEAKEILEGMDLVGSNLNVGVHALIGAMVRLGYIDELKNSILITVEGDNKTLETELVAMVNEILSASNLESSILSTTVNEDKELIKLAQDNNISIGKAKLIREITLNNPLLKFEDLATLSINELNLLAESKNATLETIQKEGSASSKQYIGKDSAQEIALSHAKISNPSFIEVELDYDDGIMVYDVEFIYNNIEYDYEINAISGEIIKYNREVEDNDDDDDDRVQSNNNQGSGTQSTSYIGDARARTIALEHAGVTASGVTELKAEFDYENGKPVYEVEFKYNNYEYEYDIDASSGAILYSDRELD